MQSIISQLDITWNSNIDNNVDSLTKSEDVAESGGVVIEVVTTDAIRKVVPVIFLSKVWKSDAVLDVDGVKFWARYQRSASTKNQPRIWIIILH